MDFHSPSFFPIPTGASYNSAVVAFRFPPSPLSPRSFLSPSLPLPPTRQIYLLANPPHGHNGCRGIRLAQINVSSSVRNDEPRLQTFLEAFGSVMRGGFDGGGTILFWGCLWEMGEVGGEGWGRCLGGGGGGG